MSRENKSNDSSLIGKNYGQGKLARRPRHFHLFNSTHHLPPGGELVLITTKGTFLAEREFIGNEWFTIFGLVVVDFENQLVYRPPTAIPIHVTPEQHVCLAL